MIRTVRFAKAFIRRMGDGLSLSYASFGAARLDRQLVEDTKLPFALRSAGKQADYAQHLGRYGFTRIAKREDFDGEAIIEKFLDLAGGGDYQQGGKAFFKTVTMPEEKALESLDVLLGDEKNSALQTIHNHFGYLPYLESVQLVRSVHQDQPLAKSQLFHLDYNARNIVKIFVYLTNVAEPGDGPLLTIRVAKWLKWLIPSFPVHKSQRLEKLLTLLGQRKDFMGQSGDIFAVQTSHLFHAGSRMEKNAERIAAIITFRSPSRIRGADPYTSTYPQQQLKTLFDDIMYSKGKRPSQ
jgi:hypothetical protein